MVAMPGEDKDKKGAHTSKRVHKRVDFFNPVKVVVPDENTAVDVFAGNVSKGGMFLRSNRPLPKGKKVKLEFETQEGKVEVEEGEVVWNKEFEPISIDGAPAGMGVQFKSMSEDSKLKIEAFIDDALKAQPPPEEPPPAPVEAAPIEAAPIEAVPVEAAPVEDAPAAEPMRMKLDVVTSQPPPPQPAAEPDASEKPPPVEGGQPVMATAPPRRRTKMMLFGGFVLLVAAVTFLTLLLIKPPGDKTGPEVTKPPAPEKPVPAPAPETPKKPEPAPEKKPEPVAEKKPEPVPEKKPEPVAEKKPEPAPVDTIQGLQVGLPAFAEKDGEWRMIITATGPVEVKHFTLKNPPRLAVDFKAAVYSGKQRTQEAPAPSVARVRIGEQPEFTRFVLDFEGSEIPQHRIVKKEDRVVVFFGR